MTNIHKLPGEESEHLLGHVCQGLPKEMLHIPGPDFLVRHQSTNCYMGRIGMINSGDPRTRMTCTRR